MISSLITGGITCFFSVDLKKVTKYKYDDACDVFAVHGVGGIVSTINNNYKYCSKNLFI